MEALQILHKQPVAIKFMKIFFLLATKLFHKTLKRFTLAWIHPFASQLLLIKPLYRLTTTATTQRGCPVQILLNHPFGVFYNVAYLKILNFLPIIIWWVSIFLNEGRVNHQIHGSGSFIQTQEQIYSNGCLSKYNIIITI